MFSLIKISYSFFRRASILTHWEHILSALTIRSIFVHDPFCPEKKFIFFLTRLVSLYNKIRKFISYKRIISKLIILWCVFSLPRKFVPL